MNTFITVWFLLMAPSTSDLDVQINSVVIDTYDSHLTCHDAAAHENSRGRGYHYCLPIYQEG